MKPHPRIRKTVKWGGLALTLLIAGVWVRSEFVSDSYFGKSVQVFTERGLVVVACWSVESAVTGYDRQPPDPRSPRRWMVRLSDKSGERSVALPLWMPLLAAVCVAASPWVLEARARRRMRRGQCPHCGYNLAGLAASTMCPECGAAAPAR